MEPSTIPKMQSKERHTDGRPVNLPGIYKHKDMPDLPPFITSSDVNAGVAQADALMHPLWQGAWERVGDVPSHTELLQMRKDQEVKDATAEAIQRGKDEAELKAAKKVALEAAQVAVTP